MENKNTWYDGTRLLSMKDINGERPSWYLVDGNRSSGKTTFFERMLINNFFKHKDDEIPYNFMIRVRYQYEVGAVAKQLNEAVCPLFFPDHQITGEGIADGLFYQLKLDGEVCGYAISLNAEEKLKKYGSYFRNVQDCYMDEFQSRKGDYLKNEVEAFYSTHLTIARGQGKHIRYVREIMASNGYSLINPYYHELGISARIQKNTKFLRGDGFVLERNFNEASAEQIKTDGISRALKNSKIVQHSADNVYLNDSDIFIENPPGRKYCLACLAWNGNLYGVKYCKDMDWFYIDSSPEVGADKYAVDRESMREGYRLLTAKAPILKTLKEYYEYGLLRFKGLKEKELLFYIL